MYNINLLELHMADEQVISESEKKKEDWMNSKWRPMMGWMYMCVCTFDFVIAPILWSLVQAFFHGGVNVQWQPLTLQGAGLFHISMGAVLGLAAYGRTQEKLAGANNGGAVGTTYTPPAPIQATVPTIGAINGNTTAPATGSTSGTTAPSVPTAGFGNTPLGGNSASSFATTPGTSFAPAPSWGTTPIATTAPAVVTGFGSAPSAAPVTGQVAPGFGGKLGPVPAVDPII
jgi:hypothetical protein